MDPVRSVGRPAGFEMATPEAWAFLPAFTEASRWGKGSARRGRANLGNRHLDSSRSSLNQDARVSSTVSRATDPRSGIAQEEAEL